MAKPAAEAAQNSTKTVPADCVSVLLMALGSPSISKAQYNMMSALDGQRTASSFEHQFRSITQKAKELKGRVDNGEVFEPVQPVKKRGAETMPKMAKRAKTGGAGGAAAAAAAARAKKTPKKKVDVQEDEEDGAGFGEETTEGADEHIKQEFGWGEDGDGF